MTRLTADGNGNVYAAYYYFLPYSTVWYGGVCRWDGSSWVTLANDQFLSVNTFAIDRDGGLCVGGFFSTVGGLPAGNVARWDGTGWSPLGPGRPGGVDAMILDGDGHVCVASSDHDSNGLTTHSIARWDGTTWSLVIPAIHNEIITFAFDDNDNVYLGGWFSSVGDVISSGIARWDGDSWSGFGTGNGLNGSVSVLAADAQGNLYAGGDFTIAGDVAASRIARWNGETWTALGTGVNGRLTSLATTPDGVLYAGGYFTTAGGAPAQGVARWDGTAWSSLDISIANVRALVVGKDGFLYAGGLFRTRGSTDYCVARWDGQSWSRVGTESWFDCTLLALTVDADGNIYAAGSFGGDVEPTHGVRKWNGSTWTAVGSWTEGSPVNASAIAVDSSGDVYVGGIIYRDYALEGSAYLARWDGTAWSTVDTWTEPLGWTNVLAFDAQGHLVVGYYFTTADQHLGHTLVRRDGSSWSTLGSGLDAAVLALAVDSRGRLAVGGDFSHAGGISSGNIGLWSEPSAAPVAPLTGPPNAILHAAAPNPFNPRTTVRFELPDAAHVRLAIHDVRGRLVRTLVDAELPRGAHGIDWNGRDERGADVASGSYFALIEAGDRREVMPLTLVK
jgi:hypothetical protein